MFHVFHWCFFHSPHFFVSSVALSRYLTAEYIFMNKVRLSLINFSPIQCLFSCIQRENVIHFVLLSFCFFFSLSVSLFSFALSLSSRVTCNFDFFFSSFVCTLFLLYRVTQGWFHSILCGCINDALTKNQFFTNWQVTWFILLLTSMYVCTLGSERERRNNFNGTFDKFICIHVSYEWERNSHAPVQWKRCERMRMHSARGADTHMQM